MIAFQRPVTDQALQVCFAGVGIAGSADAALPTRSGHLRRVYPEKAGALGISVAAERIAVMNPLHPAHDRLWLLPERHIESAKEHARKGEDAEG